MGIMKVVVKVLYRILRIVFIPIILILRPIGMRTETVISTCIIWAVVLTIMPFGTQWISVPGKVAVVITGVPLAYLIRIWGKEFET
jgi:uncharacterized membrane protein